MPFGEVYTSLQTGVVNFAENGVNVYLSNKHYEVAPVLNMTEHEANNNMLWVSDKTWNSLSAEEKKWVETAAAEVGQQEPPHALKLEKDSADKLVKLGVKVNAKVDKSGFAKVSAPIQDAARQGAGAGRGEAAGAGPEREVTRLTAQRSRSGGARSAAALHSRGHRDRGRR